MADPREKNTTATNSIEAKIKGFSSMEELLTFFEIGFDQGFLRDFGHELFKRFNGNVIQAKPSDWFEYRKALKNAYCKIQRGRLDKHTRSACRGCTTCERR
jgi:hypothetical protein